MTRRGRPGPTVSVPLAWALVALLLTGGWIGLVEPVLTLKTDYAREIADTQSVIARQRALLARSDSLAQRTSRVETLLASAEVTLIESGGATGAAALQSVVRRAGEGSGIAIDRVRVLEPKSNPPTVRLSMNGTGTMEAIQRLLHALEAGAPRLRVDRLAFAPAPGDGGRLSIEIDLAALVGRERG